MTRRICLTAFIILSTIRLQAQTYQEQAQALQKAVWDNAQPEFKNTTVPEEYRQESAVILAHSFSQERASKSKFKYFIITATVMQQQVTSSTLHERIKINDKAALEKFSTLEYQKKLDNTLNLGFTKIVNKNQTFVGAKVIKPNGKEVVVNTSEEVLTQNTSKNQQGKLAIPDLQTGDVLDYYVSHFSQIESDEKEAAKNNDNVFTLVAEYPMLYYNLNFRFDKKSNIKYIAANGAPLLQTGVAEDGDKTASLTLRNIPKYQGSIWTSPFRQYPYLEVGYGGKDVPDAAGTAGSILNSNKEVFKNQYRLDASSLYKPYKKLLQEHFGSNRALKQASVDSVVHAIYNIWKYSLFGSYKAEDVDDVDNLNYRKATSKFNTIVVSQLLTDMDIPHEVLIASPRTANTLANAYTYDDFDSFIIVDDAKPIYLFFSDVTNHYNEIPQQFQGEMAMLLHISKAKIKSMAGRENLQLPVSLAEQNVDEEQLKVALQPENMQKLKIERLVKQSGALRHAEQKRLLSAGEIDNAYMMLVKGDPLADRLAKESSTKKLSNAFNEAFAKATANRKQAFTDEVKDEYDQEPAQLNSYKVISAALDNTDPYFIYTSSFVLENMVKKAGANYIIDLGKLTGSFVKLVEHDRKRNLDVYMPVARSFKYTISLIIPPGYQAKGIGELNHRKDNKTGMFSSNAAINGNVLTLTVNRVYNHNFEQSADWSLITNIVDEASDFNNQKILLEKQGS